MTIEEIKRRNKAAGLFFFEPKTMRFFKSKVYKLTWPVGRGMITLFITSEQGPNGVRAFTVRKAYGSGRVETVGEFQQWATLADAKRRADRMTGYK